MQIGHDPRRVEIRGIFGIELLLFIAGNEGEGVNVAVQVGQHEFGLIDPAVGEQRKRPLVFRLQVVQGDAAEGFGNIACAIEDVLSPS